MATGGVENETLDKDICNCTICLDTFKVPKILPCLHTFCQSCLSTYILSTKGETSPPDYFLCPVCRTEVKPPNPKAPVEEWAKLLPLNQTIATLVDNSATGEELDEKKCDPCRRDGEVAQAEFWCFECEDGLCQVCHKYHKRMKSFTNHRSVPILDLNKEELQSKMTNIEEPCFEHPGEYLKVYCIDHQKMCCVLCLSIDHRKCENIKTFDQMAESLDETNMTLDLAKTMKTFGQKMETLIIKKQENIEVIEQQKQDILEDVAKDIERAKEKLDKCHEDFKIQMSHTHKEQNTKLVETKDRFEIFQKSIGNCEKMLQTVLKHGSLKQIFITSEKIKGRLHVQLRELQEMLKKDEDITYNFTINKSLGEVNNLMTSIADVQVKGTADNEQAVSVVGRLLSVGHMEYLLQCQLRKSNIDDLEAVKVWGVKEDGWLTDAAFLSNDTLVCVDNSNNSLLLFDHEGKLMFSHSLNYTPWGIVQSSDDTIFVSDQSTPGIRMYTLEHKTLQQINFIATTESPYGLDIIQDNVVAIQMDSVALLRLDGTETKRIGKCHQFSFVAVSKPNASCFYCLDGDCVVQYTVDGKPVNRHKFQGTGMEDKRGIAIDKAGNIYVCGHISGSVYILSKDGLSSCLLFFRDNLTVKPYSIGFDHTGTKFFLTGYNNGTLNVFKLGIKTKR